MRKNFSSIKPLNYNLFLPQPDLSQRNSQFGGYISVHYNSIRPLDEQTYFFCLDFVSFSTGCFSEKTSKRGKTPKPFNFYVEFADVSNGSEAWRTSLKAYAGETIVGSVTPGFRDWSNGERRL